MPPVIVSFRKETCLTRPYQRFQNEQKKKGGGGAHEKKRITIKLKDKRLRPCHPQKNKRGAVHPSHSNDSGKKKKKTGVSAVNHDSKVAGMYGGCL